MLKVRLAKHLLNIISDRRLAIRLRNDHKVTRACGFQRQTPSHGLFTHIRHQLGEETYLNIFNGLMSMLLESETTSAEEPWTTEPAEATQMQGSDAGEEDSSPAIGSTLRAAPTQLPIAFTEAPCNENDKPHFDPLLERVHRLGVRFRTVLADAQYSSVDVKDAAKWLGAEPIIPVRRDSRVEVVLRVGRDFVARMR